MSCQRPAKPLKTQSAPAPADRAKVVAALERLIVTGEPRHTDHDEGQWLQREVDAAFARSMLCPACPC
jgi:hypothetical protein